MASRNAHGGFENAAVRKGLRSCAWWKAATGSTVWAAWRVPGHTTVSLNARAWPSTQKNESDDAIHSRRHGSIDRKPRVSADHRGSHPVVEAAGRASSGRGGRVWEGGGGNRPSFPWVGVFEGEGQGPSPSWGERERGRSAPFRMRGWPVDPAGIARTSKQRRQAAEAACRWPNRISPGRAAVRSRSPGRPRRSSPARRSPRGPSSRRCRCGAAR